MAQMRRVQMFNFGIDSILCFVIIFIFIWPSAQTHCLHDSVQKTDVHGTHVKYVSNSNIHGERRHRHRHKRDFNAVFKPIRIKSHFTLGDEINAKEVEKIKEIVEIAVNRSRHLLSVMPVVGSLLLSRTPCTSKWISGVNKGKCSQADSVKPEYCMDYHRIPEPHLRGYSIYNSTHSQPYLEKANGQGVHDADFVLYVTAKVTQSCLDAAATATIAYASYCQVDQHNRPVAGHVNFCPSAFREAGFTTEKFSWIALHELFHALGFSKSLFDKFRKCDKNGKNCRSYSSSLLRPEDNLLKLTTPKVTAMTQEHFDCHEKDDYGGPMDISNTSHWDSRTMQGSIMAAHSDMPHLTFIDKITLALFEDSGWYKVDYGKADTYYWGRGAGCDFGLPTQCSSQTEYFCQGNERGCHYLHWDMATCRTNSVLAPCRVFKAEEGDECWKDNDGTSAIEVFSRDRRCFMANITKTNERHDMAPKCFHAYCADDQNLMVRVDYSSWNPCPAGQKIQIPGHQGYLQCPVNPAVICSSVPRPLTTIPPPTTTTTVTTTPSPTTTQPTTASITAPYFTHRVTTKEEPSSTATHCSSHAFFFLTLLFIAHTLF